jgi:hypothetical protein
MERVSREQTARPEKNDAVLSVTPVNSAVDEKLGALTTEEYLEQRPKRASRKKFESVLAKVADREPDSGDELPDGPS